MVVMLLFICFGAFHLGTGPTIGTRHNTISAEIQKARSDLEAILFLRLELAFYSELNSNKNKEQGYHL